MSSINPCATSKFSNSEYCIYCGKNGHTLTDEHVFPLAIGGRLVVENATCEPCRLVTSRLELKLLRGPFWPMRRRFGLTSRRKKEQPNEFAATLIKGSGQRLPIEVSAANWPEIWLHFFEATVHNNRFSEAIPYSKTALVRALKEPEHYRLFGQKHYFIKPDRIEYPTNIETSDLMQFLVKIAVGYLFARKIAHQLELTKARELLAGNTRLGMNFIGCNTSELLGPSLPGNSLHRILDYTRENLQIVAIQLFVPIRHDPPPIYEVVFPRIA